MSYPRLVVTSRMWRTAVLASSAWLTTAGCASDQPAVEGEFPNEHPSGDDYGTYARAGIELVSVTADQGVAIPIFEDGIDIPLSERESQLVTGRPMLLRGFWRVPEDWEPRDIEARLVLHYDGGDEQAASRTLLIEEDPVPQWLEGTFSFYLPAELVEAEMEFDLTLYEVSDPPPDALPPALVPRLPQEGAQALAPDAAPREVDIVIVPIDHQFDGGKICPDVPPSFDAERLQRFADAIYVQNPVQRVEVSVRPEPLVWTESATQLGKILEALGKLRVEDGAAPWVYYYGAIEPCDWGSDEGFAGLAFVPRETSKSEAWRRVSIGDLAVSESSSMETFVHEIGHNQERRHVPCGGPKGAVEDYPYRDGLTAAFGFDLLTWALHRPTSHDYMSYCGPAWNSHYGWNQVLPVQAELTSWKQTGASTPVGPGFVIGVVYADETVSWTTMPGTPSLDPDSTGSMEFWRDAELVATLPMEVERREDGAWEIVAPLPTLEFDTITHLRPTSGPDQRPVGRERISVLHRPITR